VSVLKNWRPFFAHHSPSLGSHPLFPTCKNLPLLLWGPLFVGPLFDRTCWACLNSPLGTIPEYTNLQTDRKLFDVYTINVDDDDDDDDDVTNVSIAQIAISCKCAKLCITVRNVLILFWLSALLRRKQLLSYRKQTALQGALVLAKSDRLELGVQGRQYFTESIDLSSIIVTESACKAIEFGEKNAK